MNFVQKDGPPPSFSPSPFKSYSNHSFPFYFELDKRRNECSRPPSPLAPLPGLGLLDLTFSLLPSISFPTAPWLRARLRPPGLEVEDVELRKASDLPLRSSLKLHSRLLLFISDLKKVLGREGLQ